MAPSDWIGLEVAGTNADGESWWINEDFCSQAHAAEWLRQPLPKPERRGVHVMSRRERLTGFTLAAAVGLLFGLAGLGLLTALRFAVGLL